MRLAVLAALLLSCRQQPDRLFHIDGREVDCHGDDVYVCIAKSCPRGYETIRWGDLGMGSVYRCVP